VVNSEEEWANIFTCGDRPEIDFSTKTLLVAFGGTTNGVANISKELLFEDNLLYLMVDIELNMYAVAEGWHVILITDKINAQEVILNLNKHFSDGTPACLWEQVTPTAPSNEQKSRLDDVFSGSNPLLGNSRSNTLMVINHREDMVKLQGFSEYPDMWMEFDWDHYSVVGGKIVTSSVSDEILSQQLLACFGTSLYQYEVEVKKCTYCFGAMGYHYFWAIYAEKIDSKDVSLTIKTVE
jgi:hypothetical protein